MSRRILNCNHYFVISGWDQPLSQFYLHIRIKDKTIWTSHYLSEDLTFDLDSIIWILTGFGIFPAERFYEQLILDKETNNGDQESEFPSELCLPPC